MKRIIAIILTLLFIFNLSACRKANNLSDDLSEVFLEEIEIITSSSQTTNTPSNTSSANKIVSNSSEKITSSEIVDESVSQSTSSAASSKYTYSTRSDVQFVPPKEEEIIYKKDFFLKHGMNFDHSISRPGSGLAQEKYMKIIKEAGFDHIRLPFDFNMWFLSRSENSRKQTYENIKKVAKLATDQGLYAIVDVHKFPELKELKTEENTTDVSKIDSAETIEKTKQSFYQLWSELSDYLKDSDSKVIFEIINEPHSFLSLDEMLNEVQNECIRRIRTTNPTRWIAAACPEYNTVENIKGLTLPQNDKNIFVTFHYYSPMKFTHQNAPWQNPPEYPESATWGSDEEIEYMRSRVKMMADWGSKNDRYVHLGEFGVVISAQQKDRVAWTRNMTKLCKEYGVAWSYWDFCFNFGVYDQKNDKWNAELYNALMNP